MTLEDLDKTEDLSLDDISEELGDLKQNIDRQSHKSETPEEEKGGEEKLELLYGIPKNVGLEYINLFKAEGKRQEKLGYEIAFDQNYYFLNKLGFGNLHFLPEFSTSIDYTWFGATLFYIKKLCPKNFENIANLLLKNPFLIESTYDKSKSIYLGIKAEDDSYIKQMIKFIEKNGESSYEYIKFCSPSIPEHTGPIDLENIDQKAVEGWISMLVIFSETFMHERESTNLMQYLMQNPQKLRNLGGKIVKEIDLNTNSGINFAFRGIIEMVKSRPDLDFPHMENESGKKLWEQQRSKIIKEYENMLRNYISRDFYEGSIDSERKDNKKPFDKIFYATQYGDEVLDIVATPKDWVQNFSGKKISDYSTGWKIVDKGPYILNTPSSKNPIEGTQIEEEYKKLNPDKQVLFDIGLHEIEKGGYLYKMEFGNLVRKSSEEQPMIYENSPQKQIFLINEYKDGLKGSKMISDIKKYVKEHPQEKILVCIEHHGGQDGSSGNGWSKEDWMELANFSPNLKIRSIRCFFGEALNNKDLYNYDSSVSGFSNSTPTVATVSEAVNDGLKKGLGFNELEIYTRLNYTDSVTPLTDDMEYTNWETGETETGKIGIAQNIKNENNGPDEYYA